MKGLNGIRMEGITDNIHINNIYISNLYNYGELGSEVCDDTENHLPIKVPYVRGYAGNNVNGFGISYSKIDSISNIFISNLHSKTGSVTGINLNPGSNVNFNENIEISNLYAASLNGEISYNALKYDINEFPNSASEVCAIKNNDLTNDELEKIEYNSISPIYNELESMNSYCLSGKVGCSQTYNVMTHLGNYDNKRTDCMYNINLNNNKGIILNSIVKYSNKIVNSKYGLYLVSIITVFIALSVVYCVTIYKKINKKQINNIKYFPINNNRDIKWKFNYYNSV